MNQRAQFAHRHQGKKTWLTDDRIQLLNDIGFIWTPHLKRSSGDEEGDNNKKEKSESTKNGVKGKKRKSSDLSREEDDNVEVGNDGNDDMKVKKEAEV